LLRSLLPAQAERVTLQSAFDSRVAALEAKHAAAEEGRRRDAEAEWRRELGPITREFQGEVQSLTARCGLREAEAEVLRAAASEVAATAAVASLEAAEAAKAVAAADSRAVR
jgi:hypothetical protein